MAIDRSAIAEAETGPQISEIEIERSQIVFNYGALNEGTNNFLSSLGISPNSPEILASIPFVNAYYGKAENITGVTENYDFMIFQTQFDLAIKEIINNKINNDNELQDQILTEYRENFKNYLNMRNPLAEYYLLAINLFNKFHLSTNLESEIKSSSSSVVSIGLSGGRSSSANSLVKNEFNSYGYNIRSNLIVDFLKNSTYIETQSNQNLNENALYRNLCQFINNTLLGEPQSSFSIGGESNVYTFPERGIYGSLRSGDDSGIFNKGLNLVSRCNYYVSGNEMISEIIDLNDNSVTIPSYTFKNLKELAKEKIGTKNNFSLGGNKLIDLGNISTSNINASSIAVEVFNETVKNEKISPEIATGKKYFNRDLIEYLRGNQNLDMKTYFNNLKDKFGKIKSGLDSEISETGMEMFNSAISTFAEIIYDGLELENLTTDSNILTPIGNIDHFASLVCLLILGDPTFYRYITISGDTSSYSQIPDNIENLSSITEYSYMNEANDTSDETISISLAGSSSRVSLADFRFTHQFYKNNITDLQYNSLKSGKKRVLINTNHYDTNPVVKRMLRSVFSKLYDFANSQSYLPKFFVYDSFMNFMYIILKNFSFKHYTSGNGNIVSSNDTNLLFDIDSIDIIASLRDLKKGTFFSNENKEKIIGYTPSSQEGNEMKSKIKEIYRRVSFDGFATFNIVESFLDYSNSILSYLNSIDSSLEKLQDIGISNFCNPTPEALMNLNIAGEKIYLPTSCFSEKPSFFTYLGSRNSNDMGIINSVLTSNPNEEDFYESEETKVLAVGIPDGLIDRLRNDAGFSTDNSIIEISFYEVNHKTENNENQFNKVYSYYFNSCLHINTVSEDQNLFDIESITDLDSFNKTSYIDNRSTFDDLTLDTENILTFNFGKIKNGEFNLKKIKTFNEAIEYNKTYKINSSDYIFNNRFSNEIIRSHVINYGLRKKFEMFSGISFDEFSFPQRFVESININTDSPSVIENRVSKSGIRLINYFEQQDYSDDLKDYLKRTSLQSCVINSKYFLNKSLAISKFERIFLIPAYKSDLRNQSSDFDFKSLIPVVSILWQ